MALILAIEPDRHQANQLSAIARGRLHAELVIEATAERALTALGDRVPDLILTAALLSPRDEAALAGRLRELDTAGAHIHTITVPVLAAPRSRPRISGMLSALRRDKSATSEVDGCDPAVFAEQCATYLERAIRERSEQASIAAEQARVAAAPVVVEAAPQPALDDLFESFDAPPTVDQVATEPAAVEASIAEYVQDEPVDASGVDLDVEPAVEPLPTEPEVLLDPDAGEQAYAVEEQQLETARFADPAIDEAAIEEAVIEQLLDVPVVEPNPSAASQNQYDNHDHDEQENHDEYKDHDEYKNHDEYEDHGDHKDHKGHKEEVLDIGDPLAAAAAATSVPDAEHFLDDSPLFELVTDAETGDRPRAGVSPEEEDLEHYIELDLSEFLDEPGHAPVDATAASAATEPDAGEITAPVSEEPAGFEMAADEGVDPGTLAPEPPAADQDDDWLEVVAALRRDVERLDAAPGVKGQKPFKKLPRKLKGKPVQDEWGFFDPEQCGFAALLAKLDEVTTADEPRTRRKRA